MKKHLQAALPHLIQAQIHLRRALSKRHYPQTHEDLDYLIKDCKDLIDAINNGVTLPP